MKKYIITKSIIQYEDGNKDILDSEIETDNIQEVRQRLMKEHNCKTVYFRFKENEKLPLAKHGNYECKSN